MAPTTFSEVLADTGATVLFGWPPKNLLNIVMAFWSRERARRLENGRQQVDLNYFEGSAVNPLVS